MAKKSKSPRPLRSDLIDLVDPQTISSLWDCVYHLARRSGWTDQQLSDRLHCHADLFRPDRKAKAARAHLLLSLCAINNINGEMLQAYVEWRLPKLRKKHRAASSFERTFGAARRMLVAGNPSAAIAEARAAQSLAESPDERARARNLLGVIHDANGEFELAVAQQRRALEYKGVAPEIGRLLKANLAAFLVEWDGAEEAGGLAEENLRHYDRIPPARGSLWDRVAAAVSHYAQAHACLMDATPGTEKIELAFISAKAARHKLDAIVLDELSDVPSLYSAMADTARCFGEWADVERKPHDTADFVKESISNAEEWTHRMSGVWSSRRPGTIAAEAIVQRLVAAAMLACRHMDGVPRMELLKRLCDCANQLASLNPVFWHRLWRVRAQRVAVDPHVASNRIAAASESELIGDSPAWLVYAGRHSTIRESEWFWPLFERIPSVPAMATSLDS